MSVANALAIEMRGITKRFPSVLANDAIDFALARGEVHALLGENGAGKSTLMNVLSGLYAPDSGEILVDGKPVAFASPHDAIARGIGMVHQHFMLVPSLTVAENVMLGDEETRSGILLDHAAVESRLERLARQYGLSVEPRAYVAGLAVGLQQRVEILKALYRDADVLILDEPTAVLTPGESDELFEVLRQLTARGKSVIFITHKLREVFAIADRITVLRGGRVVGTTTPAETSTARLASLMVGREVSLRVEKKPATPGQPILEVHDLQARDDRGNLAVDTLSLTIHAGEIVGIAGVEGNGQTELVEVLTGLRSPHGGSISLDGRDVTAATTRRLFEMGVSHVPEDRHKYGLVLSYSIADNMVLSSYYRPPFARRALLRFREIARFARRIVQEFDVRTPSVETPASSLSGGNQQKAVVGREFSRPMRLLIAAQPTRGLDVGSAEFIHRRIVQARDDGAAVLVVSAELDEVLALSDRLVVMFRGRVMCDRPAGEISRDEIGLHMAGELATPA